jgi:hypothetical protein
MIVVSFCRIAAPSRHDHGREPSGATVGGTGRRGGCGSRRYGALMVFYQNISANPFISVLASALPGT